MRGLGVVLLLVCGGCANSLLSSNPQWHLARSERFEVLTDDDPQAAEELTRDLERFHHIVLRLTGGENREAAPPLRVLLTKSTSAFLQLGGSRRVAGYFMPRRSGNYAVVDLGRRRDGRQHFSARSIVFHEYVHYAVALAGGGVPPWYNEGLAEYLSTVSFEEDGSYTHACVPMERVQWAKHRPWISLSRLFAAQDMVALGGRQADSYLQAWAVVHYFHADRKRSAQLQQFLGAWLRDRDVERAARESFGMELDELDEVIQRYSRSREFDCVRVDRPLPDPTVRLQRLEPAQAKLMLGEFLLGSQGATDRALAVLQQAAELAPDRARAHAQLARAHLRRATGERAAESLRLAKTHLAKARQLGPESPLTRLAEGEIAHARARGAAKAGDNAVMLEALNAARDAFRAAIRADETMAEAYYELGRTYLLQDSGSKEPVVVLEAANFLVPLDTDVSMTLVELHLRRGELWAALPVIEYLARTLHDEETRERLAKLHARARAVAGNEPPPRDEPATAK